MKTSKKIISVILIGGALVSFSFLRFAPQARAGAILNIQTKGGSSAGGTSLSVPLTPTGAGNLLVVGISTQGSITSIVDNKSDVFTQASSAVVAGETFAIYYAKNVASGVTSVTANFPFGTASMIVGEYSGIDPVSPLDKTHANDNGFVTGLSYTSGATAQTAQPSELLWGFSANAYSDVPVWAPTTPWTAKLTQGASFAQEQIVASQGSYAASGAANNVTSNYRIVSLLATFKAGAASSDVTAPSTPGNLSASAVSSSQINLSWAASTDNVGVAGYGIFRNGVQVGTTAATSYSDSGLSASTTYGYTVSAFDAAGNNSPQSAGVTATTQAVIVNVIPPVPPPPPPTPSASGAPLLFYSDLTSGPKTGGENNNGAYVTLFGNFGSNPTVIVGGGQVIIKTQPTPWLWYQKMSVQLGPNAQSGSIIVTNANGSSRGIPFTVRSGNIFCVSTTGSDSNNGRFATDPTTAAGTKGCWLTLDHAKNSLAAGDTAYALNGVSVSSPECPFTAYLCMDNNGGNNSGTAAAPKALIAYPGAVATIGQTGISAQAYGLRTPNIGVTTDYWVISQFVIRGGVQANDIGGQGWRFIGNDLSASPNTDQVGCSEFSTGDLAGTGPMMYYYGNNVHGCGPSPASPKNYHAVYFSTDTNHVDAAWNYIHDNFTCRAMQFHSSPTGANTNGYSQYDLHVHDNIIHDDNCNGINFATVNPSKGVVEAYNNLIYNTGLRDPSGDLQPSGDCIYSAGITNNGPIGSGVISIYNNTFYNCGVKIGNGSAVGGYNNTALSFNLKNNIIYQLNGELFTDGTNPINGSSNIFFGLGSNGAVPSVLTNTLTTNPLFVSAGSDFHLQSASPAMHSGAIISSLVSDLDGVSRPQGSAYDLGAYESGGSGVGSGGDITPPSVPSGLVVTGVTASSVSLAWSASTDNVGVAGYKIYRNNVQVGTSAGTSYVDLGLSAATGYAYNVSAYDAAGNNSAQSSQVLATTQSTPPPAPPTPTPPPPPPAPSSSTIAYVQGANKYSGLSSAFSVNVSFAAANRTGDLIIVWARWGNGANASVSDSLGNAYVPLTKLVSTATGASAQMFYATNVKGGANKVTIRLSQKSARIGLAVHEYSGAATLGVLDAEIHQSDTASPLSGTLVTSNANDLLFMGTTADSGNVGTWTAGSPFLLRQTNSRQAAEDSIAGPAGSYSGSFSVSSANSFISEFIALKPATPVALSQPDSSTASAETLSQLSNLIDRLSALSHFPPPNASDVQNALADILSNFESIISRLK